MRAWQVVHSLLTHLFLSRPRTQAEAERARLVTAFVQERARLLAEREQQLQQLQQRSSSSSSSPGDGHRSSRRRRRRIGRRKALGAAAAVVVSTRCWWRRRRRRRGGAFFVSVVAVALPWYHRCTGVCFGWMIACYIETPSLPVPTNTHHPPITHHRAMARLEAARRAEASELEAVRGEMEAAAREAEELGGALGRAREENAALRCVCVVNVCVCLGVCACVWVSECLGGVFCFV